MPDKKLFTTLRSAEQRLREQPVAQTTASRPPEPGVTTGLSLVAARVFKLAKGQTPPPLPSAPQAGS